MDSRLPARDNLGGVMMVAGVVASESRFSILEPLTGVTGASSITAVVLYIQE